MAQRERPRSTFDMYITSLISLFKTLDNKNPIYCGISQNKTIASPPSDPLPRADGHDRHDRCGDPADDHARHPPRRVILAVIPVERVPLTLLKDKLKHVLVRVVSELLPVLAGHVERVARVQARRDRVALGLGKVGVCRAGGRERAHGCERRGHLGRIVVVGRRIAGEIRKVKAPGFGVLDVRADVVGADLDARLALGANVLKGASVTTVHHRLAAHQRVRAVRRLAREVAGGGEHAVHVRHVGKGAHYLRRRAVEVRRGGVELRHAQVEAILALLIGGRGLGDKLLEADLGEVVQIAHAGEDLRRLVPRVDALSQEPGKGLVQLGGGNAGARKERGDGSAADAAQVRASGVDDALVNKDIHNAKVVVDQVRGAGKGNASLGRISEIGRDGASDDRRRHDQRGGDERKARGKGLHAWDNNKNDAERRLVG